MAEGDWRGEGGLTAQGLGEPVQELGFCAEMGATEGF